MQLNSRRHTKVGAVASRFVFIEANYIEILLSMLLVCEQRVKY